MPWVSSKKTVFGDPLVTRAAYNALDCAVTREVFDKLQAELHGDNLGRAAVYEFERQLQAPALEMTLRGIRIDQEWRAVMARRLRQDTQNVQQKLDQLATAVWGKGLNPNSPVQMKKFFYEALGLPPVYKNFKGQRRVTTDRESLEKLYGYFRARPFINCVLALRDLRKQLSVVTVAIDSDGRFRASYRVAGTETGRWSSSKNPFWTGSNAQNITDRLRRMFVADPGMKLCYADLEQAESRVVGVVVGQLFDDWSYYNACLAGDLHTTVCKMVWPNLGWAGDPKEDRAIADQKFYRDFSYRDLAKRMGHGSNYGGKPATMAKHTKVPVDIARQFQEQYFRAFPGIRQWHEWVQKQLWSDQRYLITPAGRVRHFFGRPNDSATLREAIAYVPQSSVGDILNRALLTLYRREEELGIELLAQVHDAILFQYPEDREDEIVPAVLEAMLVPLDVAGREFVIPVEGAVGYNWAKKDKEGKNPKGLQTYEPH